MNVVKTIVPGSPDAIAQVGRQSKDNASKRGDSGFSDTLGSLDKGNSSKQAPSASKTSSDAGGKQAAAHADATAVSQAQEQPGGSSAPVQSASKIVDAAALPNLDPVTDPAMPIIADNIVAPKGPDVASAPVNPPVLTAADGAEPVPVLSDLAMLVTALTKIASSTSETAEPSTSGDEPVDGEQAPETLDTTGGNQDLLSLLAATIMPVEPQAQQNGQPSPQGANSVSGLPTMTAPDDGSLPVIEPAAQTVVRLQKENTPSIDFHIESQEDGTAKLDVSAAVGDVSDVVQVVESRRFVGLAAPTNATAITSAMAADPDWAATMAGQTTNSPMISSTGQVVHVLKIQMSPVELGHVTAALKLVGDELSVQLTAHTLKGYSELQKDSTGILDALKSQGFNVEQVTVTLANSADRQDTNSSGNRQSQDTGQQGAQQGQRGNEERAQERFSRQPGPMSREDTTSYETTSQPETPARNSASRPGLVYL